MAQLDVAYSSKSKNMKQDQVRHSSMKNTPKQRAEDANDVLCSCIRTKSTQHQTDSNSSETGMTDDLDRKKTEECAFQESQKISKDIDDGLNKAIGNSKGIAQDTGKTAREEFIEILQTGNEDRRTDVLNKLVEIEKFNTMHFKALNQTVEEMCNGETLLHIALKFDTSNSFAKTFMKKYPEVLTRKRDQSFGFEGQTPLHVAIVKGSLEVVQRILKTAEKNQMLPKLLNISATGKRFKNTVLLGQLPLSVAALACKDKNFKILENLIRKGAVICEKNDDGDTVFHSLIKYADIYPDRMPDIQASFEFLWRQMSNSGKLDIRLLKNNSELTPLHLSAKLGVSELFNFIVNIQNVYRFTNIQDGLFDIREYDVTEFDRLIAYTEMSSAKKKLTILESLFDSKWTHQEAFQILNQELVEFILHKKWMAYRTPLFVWMIVHFIFMTLFTVSTINKAELLYCVENDPILCNIGEVFYVVGVINMFFGVLYLIVSGICIIKLIIRCRNAHEIDFGLIYHNIDYVTCLLAVAIGALMELFLIVLKIHYDYHLVFALICGWYFMIYFSPFSKNLVSFTFMIKKGFFEDFIPFGLVFICLLISFTGVMHMLFLGAENKVEEFETFRNSLLTMFNLGVGLNNIDVLNQARIPWLAYTLFVLFAILSFIHLFNALIAVMSQTFSDVHTDKHSYLKYNKLRMIELFEDIVLSEKAANKIPFLKQAVHWKRKANQTRHSHQVNSVGQRFYSVLHLLDDPNDDIGEKEEKRKEPEPKLKSIFRRLKQGHQKMSAASKEPNRNKTNSETDITYVQVQVEQSSKKTQFPDKIK